MPKLSKKKALGLLLLLECGEDGENCQEDECRASGSGVQQPEGPRTGRKHIWVRKELQKRDLFGEYATIFKEERLNTSAFHAANRMSPTRFEEILSLVAHRLHRQTTTFRAPIAPAERLALTLR